MNFVKTALMIFYIVVAGYGFLRLFLKDKSLFSILGWIPLAFTAGLGLLGFWGNLIMLIKLHLSFWLLALPLLPLFIYGLSKVDYKVEAGPLLKAFKNIRLGRLFLVLVVLFGVGSVLLMSVTFPLHFWDSRAVWGLKAKMLFGDRTIFSPNFLDPDRIHPHFRYPLLYPLSQAFIYFGLGQVDDWSVMLLVGLFFPFLGMFLYELLRIATGDRGKALAGAAVLAVLPVFYMMDGPAHSGYADTPLALFFLASFGLLFLWRLSGNQKFLLTGAILSSFLPLVKNEGILLLLLNLIWVGWPKDFRTARKDGLKILRNAGIFLVMAIVVISPWFLLRGNIPNVQEEGYLEQLNLAVVTKNLGKIPGIAGFFFNAFFGLQPDMMGHKFLWGGLWVIFALAAVKAFAEGKWLEIRLFWTVMLFCLFMGGIYEIAPPHLTMLSNFFRITLSITPLAIMLVVLQSEF